MDRDDWMYAAGVGLIAAGAALFHTGYGLACAGAGLVFPFVLSMLRGRPPDKGADS
jgi:hypothetical protein